MRIKKITDGKLLIHIILIIGSILMIVPFIWMILTSLKTYSESIRIPITIFPETLVWDNFKEAFDALPFGKLYYNTSIMIFARIACTLIFASMAGYAFARIEFPFKKTLFSIVLLQLMLPGQIFIIPQYLMVAKMGQLDTIFALVFPGIVSAFGTFFLRQFYMGLPDELEEAALLDGCNRWQIFIHIMLPLTKTAMVALGIFTAIFAWSDLMWPLIANISIDKMPLSTGIATLRGQFATNYPLLMAGSCIAMIPMLILYIIFQRHFVEGIALTGSKA